MKSRIKIQFYRPWWVQNMLYLMKILREYIFTYCNIASLNEEWLHQNYLLKQVLRESTYTKFNLRKNVNYVKMNATERKERKGTEWRLSWFSLRIYMLVTTKFIYCKMMYTNKSQLKRKTKFQKSGKAQKNVFFVMTYLRSNVF